MTEQPPKPRPQAIPLDGRNLEPAPISAAAAHHMDDLVAMLNGKPLPPRTTAGLPARSSASLFQLRQRATARRPAARRRHIGDIDAAWAVEVRRSAAVPLVTANVPAGFPSPADDYLDNPLDFNELLIENPAATFAIRVGGDSLIGIGIFPNDIAIVNRAATPVDGSVILALLDGEFTMKQYRRRRGRSWLEAKNPAYPDIELTDDVTFEIWGVVSKSIRML